VKHGFLISKHVCARNISSWSFNLRFFGHLARSTPSSLHHDHQLPGGYLLHVQEPPGLIRMSKPRTSVSTQHTGRQETGIFDTRSSVWPGICHLELRLGRGARGRISGNAAAAHCIDWIALPSHCQEHHSTEGCTCKQQLNTNIATRRIMTVFV